MTQEQRASSTHCLYEEPLELATTPEPVSAAPAVAVRSTAKARNGIARLMAPMPGVIVFCEKSVGDEVETGDAVLILEAMKMENIITASTSGKVLSIFVKEGEKVERGTVLAVIG